MQHVKASWQRWENRTFCVRSPFKIQNVEWPSPQILQAFHCPSVYPFDMSYCPYNAHDADSSYMMLPSEPWAMYPEGYPLVGKSGKCCGVWINTKTEVANPTRERLPRPLSGLHTSGTMDQRWPRCSTWRRKCTWRPLVLIWTLQQSIHILVTLRSDELK